MKTKQELIVNIKETFSLTTEMIKDERRISSLNVSEDFGKIHKNVIRDIEDIGSKLSQSIFTEMFTLGEYIDNYGRIQKHYMINRDGFSLLVMGFNGKKALEWKLEYIKWFNFLEREYIINKTTRKNGILIRKNMTDSIKFNVTEDSNFKKFAFSNYSKLVYKKVLGKDVKKLKLERGLTEKDNLRDYLTTEELVLIQKTEDKIAMLIESWKMLDLTDKEIYEKIKEKI